MFLLFTATDNVTVEEDPKKTKKKRKLGDRFKLDVNDEECVPQLPPLLRHSFVVVEGNAERVGWSTEA
jgi:hypothetical protein